jgi:hypothetical protein
MVVRKSRAIGILIVCCILSTLKSVTYEKAIQRSSSQYRYHQHSDHNDVQRVILRRKIIDMSTGWLLFQVS